MRGSWATLFLLVVAATADAGERRPRILLANDDGIDAPGLAAAYAELGRLGEVTVAAPAEDQSGTGHGLTLAMPIVADKVDPRVAAPPGSTQGPWYRVEARPASCVRLALGSLLKEKPDLVVSGINRGDNAGLTIYLSGTLGAAREAAFDGIPALAASLVQSPEMDYRPGAAVVARIATELLKRRLAAGVFLSVNIPATTIKGIKVVPHSLHAGRTVYHESPGSRGQLLFWSRFSPPADADPETDLGALSQGYVTVTPLRIDANDRSALGEVARWGLR